MTPKPKARPRRADTVTPRTSPIETIALAATHAGGGTFRYYATAGNGETWSGAIEAQSRPAAIFDAIVRIYSLRGDAERFRFVVRLGAGSPLWRHAVELSALLPGTSVEPATSDEVALMKEANGGLARDLTPPPPPPEGLAHATVATDGSVRDKVTGYGWVASCDDYALRAFHHRASQVGASVVLIAELRGIGNAVGTLRHRPLTILSDSKAAVAMTKRWINGDTVLPAGYTTKRSNGRAGLVVAQRQIFAQRDRLEICWTPGHRGNPLNEGADALARLASRFTAGRSGLTYDEYKARAKGIGEAFAAEFNRSQTRKIDSAKFVRH